MERTIPENSKCPSCGADRLGRYCAACGEKFIAPQDYDIRHFLLEQLPHELLHVDGKLARTLRLLFTQPGALASHYVSGRRKPYISPLGLYLFLFLLQAVVSEVLTGPATAFVEQVQESDPSHLLAHLMASRPGIDWHSAAIGAHIRETGHWLGELGTLLIFLLVAAVQELVFLPKRRRYLEHVALALNVAAFFLAFMTIAEIILWGFTGKQLQSLQPLLQSAVALGALPVYWCLAIRRFYDLRVLPSLAAALVMTATNAVAALGITTIVYAILIATA